MVKKEDQKIIDLENTIEEINLNDFNIDNIEIKEQEEVSNKNEAVVFALQKEKWLLKMPKERSEDKRRAWKWLKNFIDNNVEQKYLEWMTEEVQELMKKWKKEWRIVQDELMNAIPNAEEDLDLLDEIFQRFLELNIDIVGVII